MLARSENKKDRKPDISASGWLLALAGFAPFAGLAVALAHTHPLHAMLVDAFRTYSVVILSFLGGTRWGANLVAARPAPWLLGLSVVPALVAWAALFLPPPLGLTLLLLAYCAQGAWDSLTFHGSEMTTWYARLRIMLTLLVAAAHLLVLLALA